MIAGALIVAICLLVLGWTGEIVGLFVKETDAVGESVHVCRETPLTMSCRPKLVPLVWQSSASMPWILLSMPVRPFTLMVDDLDLAIFSTIIVSKFDCRYLADIEATAWISVG